MEFSKNLAIIEYKDIGSPIGAVKGAVTFMLVHHREQYRLSRFISCQFIQTALSLRRPEWSKRIDGLPIWNAKACWLWNDMKMKPWWRPCYLPKFPFFLFSWYFDDSRLVDYASWTVSFFDYADDPGLVSLRFLNVFAIRRCLFSRQTNKHAPCTNQSILLGTETVINIGRNEMLRTRRFSR